MNTSAIIITIVVLFAILLVYMQCKQPKIMPFTQQSQQSLQSLQSLQAHQLQQSQQSQQSPLSCPSCELLKKQLAMPALTDEDPIKRQDINSMYDPLTYPEMRLPREILDKYNEYYRQNGEYPPFNQATRMLADNPIINGVLVKEIDANEPFADNVPATLPLFRMKSVKNTNRFFYYIIDQRQPNTMGLKITLDNVKVNNKRYPNSDYSGLPELYDGDIIENISIFPNSKFKAILYKQHHFP